MTGHLRGSCPHCGARLKSPEDFPPDREVTCPMCSQAFLWSQLTFPPALHKSEESEEGEAVEQDAGQQSGMPERGMFAGMLCIALLAVFAAGFAVGVVSCWSVGVSRNAVAFSIPWLVMYVCWALLIVFAAAEFKLVEYYMRLIRELALAKGKGYTAQTIKNFAHSQYNKLLKQADEIEARHERHFADQLWIWYLTSSSFGGSAGQAVMDSYRYEMELLRAVQGLNKDKRKARQKATESVAKADIRKEVERRMKLDQPEVRWDDENDPRAY